MTAVTCDKCHGKGTLDLPNEPCRASIKVRHETIDCYASRPHPGEPHMALAGTPCARCRGMDDHSKDCPADTVSPTDIWWAWEDGDVELRDSDKTGHDWSRKYGPNAIDPPLPYSGAERGET